MNDAHKKLSDIVEFLDRGELAKLSDRELSVELYYRVVSVQKLILNNQEEILKLHSDFAALHMRLSKIMPLSTVWSEFKYDHSQNALVLGRHSLRFGEESQESLLLSLMFNKGTQLPKRTTWYCQEVAERFDNKGYDLKNATQVYKTLLRINDKVTQHFHVESIVDVSPKKFKLNFK